MSSPMGITVPVPLSTPGPDFASDVSNALNTIDVHTHVSGQGNQVPTAGLNINADLPLTHHNLTQARAVIMDSQSAPLNLGADIGCLYVVNGDLWFNQVDGTQIKLTASGSLNAALLGGFTNLTAPAEAIYASGDSSFTFTSNGTNWAVMKGSSIQLAQTTSGSTHVTVQATASGSNPSYTLTLPATVPANTGLLSMANSGAVAVSNVRPPVALPAADAFVTMTSAGILAAPYPTSKGIGGDSLDVATLVSSSTVVQCLTIADDNSLARAEVSFTWTAATPTTGWSATNGLSYAKDGFGVVHLRGSGVYASGAGVIFTLPTGFRPAAARKFPIVYNDGADKVLFTTIGTDGTVTVGTLAGSNIYYLDSVQFNVNF